MGINIAQKTNNFSMDSVKFGKVHGQTKIELYDVNKRIKKVYRDENTFQSQFLASYMRSLGEADCNPFRNDAFRGSKPWTNLVGGLFLFKDTITAGAQYMPAGNQMIGCGSYNVQNTSAPNSLGSYNVMESSESINAITQVYDFTTSQANGNINCVCLTSQTGGYIGYGNINNDVAATKYDWNRNQTSLFIDQLNSHNTTQRSVIIGNIHYKFINNGDGTITVEKTKVGLTVGSIFQSFSASNNYNFSDVGNHAGITTQNWLPIGTDGTNIYLIANKSQVVDAGNIGYYYKYDTTNDTFTEMSFTNSSSYKIDVMWASISNGCIFCKNENSTVYVFDLSTSVLLADLSQLNGRWNFNTVIPAFKVSTGLTMLQDANDTWIYDHSSTVARKINGSMAGDYQTYTNDVCDCINFVEWNFYGQMWEYVYKNPLYLATINNLQSQVTKTAAQTMKVTYTLTEASE